MTAMSRPAILHRPPLTLNARLWEAAGRHFLPAIAAAFTLFVFPLFAALFAALPQPRAGAALPRLTYTKVLRESFPEFVAITVSSDGSGSFEGRKLDEPPNPRPLKLSQDTTRRLFELADALGDFKSGDLESHKKVANLGLKTLTYEAGGQTFTSQFNYTINRDAQELVNIFEKISSVEQHVAALEFAIRYDHLGLPQELLQIEIDLDNKALANPELMVPELEQIARNPRFLHVAQARAQNILQRLQASN